MTLAYLSEVAVGGKALAEPFGFAGADQVGEGEAGLVTCRCRVPLWSDS
jgi:hypothetical protein